MANVLINETSMTSIGNAIRSKLGVETTYLPSEMASAIQSIPSGGAMDYDDIIQGNYSSVTSSTASFVATKAFTDNPYIVSVNLPNVTAINDQAFAGCTNMTSIQCPSVLEIGEYAFERTVITQFEAQSCTTLGMGVFMNCASLASVSLPSVQYVVDSYTGVFYHCFALSSVNLPSATYIGNYAFTQCTSLQSLELPSVTSMGMQPFYQCSSLTRIVIGTQQSQQVCAGGTQMFRDTPIASGSGHIYVADSLVEDYKQATYWSDYANQIKGISEIS